MATGLPLYKWMPVMCDTSLVSPLKAHGVAQPRAANEPGAAIASIEDTKTPT